MRKRAIKLWRLQDDGRKLFAGTIIAGSPAELVAMWSAFLVTAERGVYFATYRGISDPLRQYDSHSCSSSLKPPMPRSRRRRACLSRCGAAILRGPPLSRGRSTCHHGLRIAHWEAPGVTFGPAPGLSSAPGAIALGGAKHRRCPCAGWARAVARRSAPWPGTRGRRAGVL